MVLLSDVASKPELPVEAQNALALAAFGAADPILTDVRPAGQVVPGMTPRTVLTSGPPLPWERYTGGQRRAVLGAVVHEGLAGSLEDAERAIKEGDVEVASCHDHSSVGSLAGVTSASMPVVVVEDRTSGRAGYCTLFEGATPARLNYGVWNEAVAKNLTFLAEVIGPALSNVIRATGGLPLLPIMQRAVNQGDELHSRNTAASLLLLRELVPALVGLDTNTTARLVPYLTTGDYFFLRPSMAAAKVMADSMSGFAGSSIVTAMSFSCQEFGIRVAGLGDEWFRGPLPHIEASQLFEGHTTADIEIMGGDSLITEVCGLGGFAQAAALTLQGYQGDTQQMVTRNLEMYRITATESPHFKIPQFGYRGTPTAIDVHKVAGTGVAPTLDVGIAGREGGQIGAGSFRAPLQPFLDAHLALAR